MGQSEAGSDVHDLLLDAVLATGALLLASGASTSRVIATSRACAQALRAERIEVSVSSLTVTVTLRHDGCERSASRKAAHHGVSLSAIDAVLALVEDLERGRVDLGGYLPALAAIAGRKPAWSRPAIVAAVAVACGTLAGLAGGDALAMLAATAGAALGKMLQFAILGLHRPPAAAAVAAAFVAGWTSAFLAHWSATPTPAVAAAILFLVPGVPLVNGVADLLEGHPLNGVARLASAGVIVLAMAVGLTLATRTGVWS